MKNTFKLFGIIALVAAIGFSTAACKAKTAGSSDSAAASSASADSAPATAPAASSAPDLNRIDGLLDDYEKFVGDYAALMKKLMDGDAAAVTDAEKLEAQVDDWAERWAGVSESDFTPAQTRRWQEIVAQLNSLP